MKARQLIPAAIRTCLLLWIAISSFAPALGRTNGDNLIVERENHGASGSAEVRQVLGRAYQDKVLSASNPDGLDQTRDAIMSFEEYSKAPFSPMPHILVLTVDTGQLFYFGTRHTFDPNDWQIRAIEDYWHQFHATLALNEGGDPPVLDSREEMVQRFGEAGLVRFLAKASGVPVRSLEPPREQEHELLLRDFSVEQVKLFYVLRGVVQFRKSHNDERVEDFVERVVRGLSHEPGLEGPPRSFSQFEGSYARLLGEPTDWRAVPDEWFDPAIPRPPRYTNRISRQLSEFRDRYMVKLLISEVKRGHRVFAVVGGSHVIMQERALRAALASPLGQTTNQSLERIRDGRTPLAGPPDPLPFDAQDRLNRNRPGPWDNDVLVYYVGATGQVVLLATFERAGVPTLARLKDGRLIAAHQHFPEQDEANFDKVAVHLSSDEGKTWTSPQVIRLAGLPEGMRFPFDPTLVPLPDGRVRLYFTSLRGRRFEESPPAIYSAISTDGMEYSFEPGMRLGIEGRPVIDCAVVLHQRVFHLYSPDNGSRLPPSARVGADVNESGPPPGVGYHAVSKDGLKFTRVDDVRIKGQKQWLGNAQSDGHVITFFGTGQPGGLVPPGVGQPQRGIWMATSTDGQAWTLLESPPLPGADPGAVATRDGGWIVAVTGPPRPGTPSERRVRGGQQPGK